MIINRAWGILGDHTVLAHPTCAMTSCTHLYKRDGSIRVTDCLNNCLWRHQVCDAVCGCCSNLLRYDLLVFKRVEQVLSSMLLVAILNNCPQGLRPWHLLPNTNTHVSKTTMLCLNNTGTWSKKAFTGKPMILIREIPWAYPLLLVLRTHITAHIGPGNVLRPPDRFATLLTPAWFPSTCRVFQHLRNESSQLSLRREETASVWSHKKRLYRSEFSYSYLFWYE